ncbi:MAG: hypothetical protein A2078_13730 [Nitrospirae bacterium GWC2_57_9]|nr:MAG: hypothetical protein A2078_13730 [Nitrospirae bacterium GWC2_57_9]
MANAELNENQLGRARNAAYRYLSLRPRSRAEVERKLTEKEFPPAVIQTVLAGLDRLGYVNDREFAGLWARSRVRLRGFGRRRIEQELRSRGVSRDIIHETLAGLFADSSEAEVARKEAQKKLKALERFEPCVRRRRLAGHLERKGFSSDIITAIIRDMHSLQQ